MKTKSPFVFLLALCALFVGFLRSQEVSTPPSIDTSKLFIVESHANAFVIQTYNRIFVGTWLEIRGKDVKGAQSITISDTPPFAPTEVRVIVKNEPVIAKRDDGTWEITFKEIKP
jgi:hypothetical protein